VNPEIPPQEETSPEPKAEWKLVLFFETEKDRDDYRDYNEIWDSELVKDWMDLGPGENNMGDSDVVEP
jgi:hypothetical protein